MRLLRLESGRTLKAIPNGPSLWIKAHERAFARRGARDLGDIMQIFGLGATATGRIFGVSRQAVDQWLVQGVPLGRLADVGAVAQAARTIHAYFRPERIPQIVTEPIPGLDGRTILDVAQTDPRRIVELVEATRSYDRWQAMEREASADIAAGRVRRFDSVNEFIAELDKH